MTDKRSQPCNRSYGSVFLSRKCLDKANSYNPTLTPPPVKKNPAIKRETERKEKTFM